ncbi:hypothetical protein NUS68_11295, partial [Glaesserella parasuis]|nr:hypothetical protein [Glaesserella parasuis]
MAKITVLVDVHPALFSDDPFRKQCFDNIKAINPEEQYLIDECIDHMIADDNELLLRNQPILINNPELANEDLVLK